MTLTPKEVAKKLNMSREWAQKKIYSLTKEQRQVLGIYRNSSGWQVPIDSVEKLKNG